MSLYLTLFLAVIIFCSCTHFIHQPKKHRLGYNQDSSYQKANTKQTHFSPKNKKSRVVPSTKEKKGRLRLGKSKNR